MNLVDFLCQVLCRLPCFVVAEVGSRLSQFDRNLCCERVRHTEYAPRDPLHVLERRHGLAQIVERGAGVKVERLQKPVLTS